MTFQNAETMVLNKLIKKRLSKLNIDVLYHIFDYLEENYDCDYFLDFQGVVIPLYNSIRDVISYKIQNPPEFVKAGVKFIPKRGYATLDYFMYRINKNTLFLQTIHDSTHCILFSNHNSYYCYNNNDCVLLENYYYEDDEYSIDNPIMIFYKKNDNYLPFPSIGP